MILRRKINYAQIEYGENNIDEKCILKKHI